MNSNSFYMAFIEVYPWSLVSLCFVIYYLNICFHIPSARPPEVIYCGINTHGPVGNNGAVVGVISGQSIIATWDQKGSRSRNTTKYLHSAPPEFSLLLVKHFYIFLPSPFFILPYKSLLCYTTISCSFPPRNLYRGPLVAKNKFTT